MSAFDKIKEAVCRAVGKAEIKFVPPLVRASHCRRAMREAKPGMAICRKYNGHLATMLIPGEFSHSGIIESSGMVIHAVGDGVGREDILDFVKDTDGYIILSATAPFDAEAAIQYARAQLTKDYDFKFDGTNEEALFCHELTARSLRAGGIEIEPVPQQMGLETHQVFLASQFVTHPRLTTVYRTEF